MIFEGEFNFKVNFGDFCGWIIMTRYYYWWLLVSLLLTISYIPESQQLVIKNINVPTAVNINNVDYVILDCDYELENTSSRGLVVKWFFEGNELVYQWIYGRNPLAEEPAKKYIDLAYRASDDPYTEYRAMKLIKPGIDLTGDYTCEISTFQDERVANASMVVYSTEEKFDLDYKMIMEDDKEGLEVTCQAEGLYPQPTLDISVKNMPEKQASKPMLVVREDGHYDILSRIELLDEELPEATTVLECTLDIPRVNYSTSRKKVYYSGPATTTSATTIPQHKMDFEVLDSSNPGNGGGNFVNRATIDILLLPVHLLILALFH